MRVAVLTLASLLLGLPGAWAGNREMMAQAGAELVQINHRLLQELGASREAGEYHIVARIVERDGKKIIAIDQLDRRSSDSEGGTEPTGDGTTYIQYGPIPQSGVFPSARGSAAKPSGGAAALDRVDAVLRAHPGARLMELDGASVRELPVGAEVPPGGGALLIYW
jgi:hypothetical protein